MKLWLLCFVALLFSAVVAKHDDLLDDDDDIDPNIDRPLNDDDNTPTPPASAQPTVTSDKKKPVIDDEEDSYFDEDEFEGTPLPPASSKTTSQSASASPANSQPAKPQAVPVEKDNYFLEIGALAFIVLYILNFFVGRRSNEQIAKKWFTEYRPIFHEQFSELGAYDAGATAGTLMKESQNSWKFFCSGRRFCQGALVSLDLKARQDLFSYVLALVDLSNTRDTVTIEIPMDHDAMEPMVFAVARKREANRFKKNNKDIENFAAKASSANLGDQFIVFAEAGELSRDFLDDRVANILKNNQDLFLSLHLSDQQAPTPNVMSLHTRSVLRFRFLLPDGFAHASKEQFATLGNLTKLAMLFIDRVGLKQLSAPVKEKALARRKKAAQEDYKAALQQRQEQRQKQKEEQKRKEEEDKSKLSKEQLRKREEREYKKQLKAKAPKVKMIR